MTDLTAASRPRTWLVMLVSLTLTLLAVPTTAHAANATGVVFNNLSLSTALNTDPSSDAQTDDSSVVHNGDRLYLGSSSDPTKLSGWVTEDDGTKVAFGPGDYTLTAAGDHKYSLSVGDPAIVISVVQSANVPTMYIKTANGLANIEASKDNTDVGGSMSLIKSDGTVVYNNTLSEMKGRGNTTWNMPKKPYQIKLAKSTELVAGAGASKTWVLLANYLDASLIRNEVAYNMEGAVLQRAGATDYSIKGQMVDLYIDGGYRGSYYLSERCRWVPPASTSPTPTS